MQGNTLLEPAESSKGQVANEGNNIGRVSRSGMCSENRFKFY